MGALLALSSAVVYGVVDYAGGVLSRPSRPFHFAVVAFLGQVGGLVPALGVARHGSGSRPRPGSTRS